MKIQERILEISLKLFTENGLHFTPTSKIAREANIATGTLFYYYKTKEELILALYKSIRTNQLLYLYKDFSNGTSVEELFKSYFFNDIIWNKEKHNESMFLKQFHVSSYSLLISEEYVLENKNPILNLIKDGIKKNVLKKLPEELIYNLINSYLEGVNEYLKFNKNHSDEIILTDTDLINILWNTISLK